MPLTGNDIILTLCRKYISPGKEIKGHIIEPLEQLKIQQKEAFCFHAAYQHQTEFPSVQFFLLFFSDRSPVAKDERIHYPGTPPPARFEPIFSVTRKFDPRSCP